MIVLATVTEALTLAATCGCFRPENSCTTWPLWRCCLTARRTRNAITRAIQRTLCGEWMVEMMISGRRKSLGNLFISFPLLSMDIHPSRELVASGQRAGRDRKSQAHVRIWSTESLQTLYVFGMGELDRGVTSVAFSQLVGF